MIELTQEEINHIIARRQQNAETLAYNRGLEDAYRLVASTPMSETRSETLQLIADLRKPLV